MASHKSRLIRLLSGTRTLVGDIPSYATATELLVKDLTPRRIEGDYQAQEHATGFEGAQGDRLYNESMGLDFMIDAALPAAGTAPLYGDLLKATGLVETIVADTSTSYSLQPEGSAKAEIALQYLDTQSMQVTEKVRGGLTFTAETKSPPMFGFKFMGELFDGQAAVVVAPDFSGWPDAPECSPRNMSAFTVDGTELCVQSFTFTDGRTPRRGKFMNCDDTDITERNVTGRMVVEMPPAETIDLLSLCRSGAKQPLVWQLGAGTGNVLRVAAPAVQIKYGGEQNISGTIGIALDLVFCHDQGDDEFAITFS
jgi:hypothetical protein